MIMILYWVFLFILIVLWILFVYNLNVTIFASLSSLKIVIFKIPIINLKNNKFKRFITKLIPTSKQQVLEEIDLTSLLKLIHYDLVEVKVLVNVNDYVKLVMFNYLIGVTIDALKVQLEDLIKQYSYLVEESSINDIKIHIKCNCNIGIILLNYLIIKGRYKYAKTDK